MLRRMRSVLRRIVRWLLRIVRWRLRLMRLRLVRSRQPWRLRAERLRGRPRRRMQGGMLRQPRIGGDAQHPQRCRHGPRRPADRGRCVSVLHQSRPSRFSGQEAAEHRPVVLASPRVAKSNDAKAQGRPSLGFFACGAQVQPGQRRGTSAENVAAGTAVIPQETVLGAGTGSFSRRIRGTCVVLLAGCPTWFPGKCACPPCLANGSFRRIAPQRRLLPLHPSCPARLY